LVVEIDGFKQTISSEIFKMKTLALICFASLFMKRLILIEASNNEIKAVEFLYGRTDNVSVQIQTGSNWIRGVTICFRIRFARLQNSVVLTNDGNFVVQFSDYSEANGYVELNDNAFVFVWPSDVIMYEPFVWYSFCLTYTNMTLAFYLNGYLVQQERFKGKNATVDLGDRLYLNRNAIPFYGKTTDLNVWNEPLSDEEIKQFARCKVNQILDGRRVMPIRWSTAKLGINNDNVRTFSVSYDELCPDDQDTKLELFNVKMTFDKAVTLCSHLGGQLWLPQSKEDLKTIGALLELYDSVETCAKEVWVPIKRSTPLSNMWLNAYNETHVVSDLHWLSNQPNGKGIQTCIVSSSLGYSDMECLYKFCSICKVKKYPIFNLRRTCNIEESVDTKYTFQKNEHGDFEFRGFSQSSSFIGNTTSETWDFVVNDIAYRSSYPLRQFPIGVTTWTVDGEICNLKLSMVKYIQLHQFYLRNFPNNKQDNRVTSEDRRFKFETVLFLVFLVNTCDGMQD